MSMMNLGPGREFDRIRELVRRLGPAAGDIGDDCAILPDGPGRLVVSVDLSVEGVHFRRDWLTFEEIGWRATAAALSDIAAEGGSVVGVLVSVGVPTGTPDGDLTALMSGVGGAAAAAGGRVLGGDLSASAAWLVDVTAMGRAPRPVTRGGASPGDTVWVTGALGGARAALEDWRQGRIPSEAGRRAFVHPEPRIRAGQVLARHGARAMIDLSDGLGGDAPHIAAASGVALEITLDHLPVSEPARGAATRAGMAPEHFAALGGEDYELLVVLPPTVPPSEQAELADEAGVPLTRIGAVSAGEGVRFVLGGRDLKLAGFDHFAGG